MMNDKAAAPLNNFQAHTYFVAHLIIDCIFWGKYIIQYFEAAATSCQLTPDQIINTTKLDTMISGANVNVLSFMFENVLIRLKLHSYYLINSYD